MATKPQLSLRIARGWTPRHKPIHNTPRIVLQRAINDLDQCSANRGNGLVKQHHRNSCVDDESAPAFGTHQQTPFGVFAHRCVGRARTGQQIKQARVKAQGAGLAIGTAVILR